MLPVGHLGAGPSGRGPDARTEHELRKWETPWKAVPGDGPMPSLEWPADLGRLPAPLNGAMLKKAAASFKRQTGLGPDRFHPRWATLLSDQAMETPATLLNNCEAAGR